MRGAGFNNRGGARGSFASRGAGRGTPRGANNRGGARGGFSRGGARGGLSKGGSREEFPPSTIEVAGEYSHNAKEDLIFKCVHKNVPLCDSNIYNDDKTLLGKLDEVLGPISGPIYFSVKLAEENKGKKLSVGDKCYINPMRVLPLERFLPPPEKNPLEPKEKKKKKAAANGAGGFRGGRGGGSRGGGGFRGGGFRGGAAAAGGFASRGGRGGAGAPRGGAGGFRGGRGGGFRGGRGTF
jgi:H/ACA ribonucleoprotein complex subunit 1